MAVVIVIDERAAGVPALGRCVDAVVTPAFCRDIGEGAVAVVVPERAIAPVGDEQVVEAVVIVIAGADALAPAGTRHTGLDGYVGERAVAIVFVEAADRGLVPAASWLRSACR